MAHLLVDVPRAFVRLPYRQVHLLGCGSGEGGADDETEWLMVTDPTPGLDYAAPAIKGETGSQRLKRFWKGRNVAHHEA